MRKREPLDYSRLLDTKAIDRFRAKRVEAAGDECWVWTSTLDKDGYALFWLGDRTTRANHVTLEIDGRPRVDGKHALHSCDNPRCVRPSHLRWGTNLENIQDKVKRGRVRRGASHPTATDPSFIVRGEAVGGAKLKSAQVLEIYQSGGTHTATAIAFGVSLSTVWLIRKRRSWRHVTRDLPDWGMACG